MSGIIDWLLEDENISIKYRTLTEIYDYDANKCLESYDLICKNKQIIKMLEKTQKCSYDIDKDYGNMTYLRYLTNFAEFGLHKDERIDLLVNNCINYINKQFQDNNDYSGCELGLILRALVMLGYYEREDVKIFLIEYMNTQLFDGGFICKRLLCKKPERKSCYKANVASLFLFVECKRKGITIKGEKQLVNYFLKRDIFLTSDKTGLVVNGKVGWRFIDNFFPVETMRMGLPMIVYALSFLTDDKNNPAFIYALKLLDEKRNVNGRLILEGTLTKQLCNFGKVNEENKWLTFYAELANKYKSI